MGGAAMTDGAIAISGGVRRRWLCIGLHHLDRRFAVDRSAPGAADSHLPNRHELLRRYRAGRFGQGFADPVLTEED